jgi:predicted lysophospholipase L1 biosynthesis ABC-type transport system permease subunit
VGRLALTAVVVGLAAGLAIGVAAGTRRTDSAPDRYTAGSGGDPDLVITQVSGPPVTAQVRGMPGVDSVGSRAFVTSFLVSPTDGSLVLEPNPFAGDSALLGTRVVAGRFPDPDAADEFTVNRAFASLLSSRFGTRIGDRFDVRSFDQDQLVANRAFQTGEPPAVAPFTGTLVGITESAAEFDDPSPTMEFPPSFLAAHPDVGVVQTVITVRLARGADPNAVVAAVRRLPNGADAYPVVTRVVSADARRAVRFQVTALWLVAAAVAIAAAGVIALVVGRGLSIDDDERSSLAALGWSTRHLVAERTVEGGVIAVLAAPIAAGIGYALSTLFPLGVLHRFEPDPGPRMDWLPTVGGLLALVALVVATGAFTARRRRRVSNRAGSTGRLAAVLAATGVAMPLATGVSLAASDARGRRRSLRSVVAGAIGLAGIVAAGIVGLTVTTIVDHPPRWGVNYDQLFGNPYVAAPGDIVSPVLADPDVAAMSAANIGSLTINGHDIATFAVDAVKGDILPATLKGRRPAQDDEIGLGAEVARRLEVAIGDEIEAAGPGTTVERLHVVGIVVTPDSAGNGATMTFSGYARLNPAATRNILLVRFRDDARPDAAARLAAANFSPPGLLIAPTSVRALERVVAAPFLLGVVLSVLLIVSWAYILATTVRDRHHDLAVLRALGCRRRQLRGVVHWYATCLAAIIILIGLPLGVIAGRRIVALMTDAVGIVPGAEVPPVLVGAFVLLTVALANVLALSPARRAARTSLTALLIDHRPS